MQQSMRLNKKREETQGGFEEQLMSSELKWMAFADATDLNITNWGFMQSMKNSKECTYEVISSHSGRRKPIDGMRNAAQVFNNPKYKIIYLK